MLAVGVVVLGGGSAEANQFTVQLRPTPPWCSAFAVSSNDPPYFSFHCSGNFEVSGDPMGSASAGQAVDAWVSAPTGITITGASATGSVYNLNDGSGWVGGSMFYGGGTAWVNGTTSMIDSGLSSPYWGATVQCAASCTAAGRIFLNSIILTASEPAGPNLTPTGSDNLWFQTRRGESIWNPPGDPWPLTLVASDPSGVCGMSATVGNHLIPGPSAVPQISQWQQCPDPTWSPAGGASVDTRAYVPGNGLLPLTLSATNAAGVVTSEGEKLQVDNDPVTVLLSTSNDASRTIWANHAVTVFATANAGPSGVGGTNCSVGSSSPQPSTARGITVDGDGVHTVVCTAWNNAVGPQGQPNTTTSSTAVHIDEAPPVVTFEPQQPGDPTGLIVDATDSESGVAGGSVEMAPAGTGSWTNVRASFNGTHLLAHVDDAGLHGAYIVRGTSCDNVGNCASTSERLSLPLRLASDSEVSLTRIVKPRRCATRRTLTHRRSRRVERLCPGQIRATRSLRVAFGQRVTIHGLYTTGQGLPLAGQAVHIFAAPDNHTGGFAPITTVVTAGDGTWTATVPPGPSRIIRAVTDGSATILPSSGQVTTIVPAEVKLLNVWPRHVPWGGTVHLVGQLVGGYLPPGGALVRLRIGIGSTRTTYGVREHVTGHGRFTTTYTFGLGEPSVHQAYWFQIASLPMGDYPYAPSASRRVSVLVGGR